MGKSPEMPELLKYRIEGSHTRDHSRIINAWRSAVNEFDRCNETDPEETFIKYFENDLVEVANDYPPYVEILRHTVAARVMHTVFPQKTAKHQSYSVFYSQIMTIIDVFLEKVLDEGEVVDLDPVMDNMLGSVSCLERGDDEDWKHRLKELFQKEFDVYTSLLRACPDGQHADRMREQDEMKDAVFHQAVHLFYNGFPADMSFKEYFDKHGLDCVHKLQKLKEPYRKEHGKYPLTREEEGVALEMIPVSYLTGEHADAPNFTPTGVLKYIREALTDYTRSISCHSLLAVARHGRVNFKHADYIKGQGNGEYLRIFGSTDPLDLQLVQH